MKISNNRMKQFYLAAGLAGLVFTFSSCEKIVGEGPVVTEPRNVTATFQSLSVNIPADVYFMESVTQSVTLEAQQNILDEIETVVLNGVLRIRLKNPDTRLRTHEPIVVRIAAPDVHSFDLNGSGNLEIEGAIDPTDLRLTLSGSGNIHADKVTSNKIESSISGSGQIIVDDGEANEERITMSGSGLIDLSHVEVKDADAQISGSGTMKVFPTHSLKARISGSGTVFYRGNPAIDSKVSGSGAVVKM